MPHVPGQSNTNFQQGQYGQQAQAGQYHFRNQEELDQARISYETYQPWLAQQQQQQSHQPNDPAQQQSLVQQPISPIQRPGTAWKQMNALSRSSIFLTSLSLVGTGIGQDDGLMPNPPSFYQQQLLPPPRASLTGQLQATNHQKFHVRSPYPAPYGSPYISPYQPRSAFPQPPPPSTHPYRVDKTSHPRPCGCCPNWIPSELIRQGNAYWVTIPPTPNPIPGPDSGIRWIPDGK